LLSTPHNRRFKFRSLVFKSGKSVDICVVLPNLPALVALRRDPYLRGFSTDAGVAMEILESVLATVVRLFD
jgi:hypothetical protein